MTTTEDAPLTAGQILRQARELRKLSVAEVALQLNLRVSLVNQIETDELDSSMLDTFVRGYLKAYARLVKVPEQQVLQAFSRQNGNGDGPAKPMQTFSNRTGHQATETRFIWLTYAIALILLFMLVLWWWQTASPLADNPATERQATAQSQAQPEAALATPAATATLSEPATGIDETEPALADTEVASLAVFSNAEAISGSNNNPQADVIDMVFKDNCWIDVLDAEGNRIAYGTKQAGYKMTVSGKAPFVVTLGNPSVVTVTLNNQPFDMSSLPAGRVAKFTLAEPD